MYMELGAGIIPWLCEVNLNVARRMVILNLSQDKVEN